MRQTVQFVFAWFPVSLYRVEGGQWTPVGRIAWLRMVRRVRTMWLETYYTEIED